jgi:hypothetical protein
MVSMYRKPNLICLQKVRRRRRSSDGGVGTRGPRAGCQRFPGGFPGGGCLKVRETGCRGAVRFLDAEHATIEAWVRTLLLETKSRL